MRNKLFCLFFVLICTGLIQACSKNSQNLIPPARNFIQITVSPDLSAGPVAYKLHMRTGSGLSVDTTARAVFIMDVSTLSRDSLILTAQSLTRGKRLTATLYNGYTGVQYALGPDSVLRFNQIITH